MESIPYPIGGSWKTLVTQSSQGDSGSSFYLAFIVALHVATALALLWFFRAAWVRIIRGFLRSVRRRIDRRQIEIDGSDERLAWLIVIATIRAGATGLALEHTFRTIFAKPLAASIFLFVNGLILLAGERLRLRTEPVQPAVQTRMLIPGGSPELDRRGGRRPGRSDRRRPAHLPDAIPGRGVRRRASGPRGCSPASAAPA